MPFVSFIVGFRNREPERVKAFIRSLAWQSDQDFELIFVDYGSREATSETVRELLAPYSFARYHFFNTRGQNWNRGRCLNHGVSQCAGKYIFTSDIDFIFAHDFVKTLKIHADEKNASYYKVGFLSPAQSREPLEDVAGFRPQYYSDENAIGALLVARGMFDALKGYDEFFEIWGLEDNDLLHRIKSVKELYITFRAEEVHIWHLWHLPVKQSDILPEGWLRFLTDYSDHKKRSGAQNQVSRLDRNRPLLTDTHGLSIKTYTVSYGRNFLGQFLAAELKTLTNAEILEINFDFSAYESANRARINRWVRRINGIPIFRRLPLLLINRNMSLYLDEKEARTALLYFIKSNNDLIRDYVLPEDLRRESFRIMKF